MALGLATTIVRSMNLGGTWQGAIARLTCILAGASPGHERWLTSNCFDVEYSAGCSIGRVAVTVVNLEAQAVSQST